MGWRVGSLRLASPLDAPAVSPAEIPIARTPHQAYTVGAEAARRGDDLHTVVYAALRSWPIDLGLDELAELVTSATLGYWTEDARP